MAYTFFGLGDQTGFLAISEPYLYGPERGLLGIVLNTLFMLFLWKRVKFSDSGLVMQDSSGISAKFCGTSARQMDLNPGLTDRSRPIPVIRHKRAQSAGAAKQAVIHRV
jgi:hypothetical protein